MPRKVYVYREGQGVIPKEDAEPLYIAPMVIRDQMNELRHPATGRIMDSKSAFRQATKDAGCVEVGTSSFPKPERFTDKTLAQDVGAALQKVRNGYRPDPVYYPGMRGDGWQ